MHTVRLEVILVHFPFSTIDVPYSSQTTVRPTVHSWKNLESYPVVCGGRWALQLSKGALSSPHESIEHRSS
jgi:hypothetical protein